MNKVKLWLDNARAVALPQSLIPAFTALCLASNKQSFSLIYGVIAALGVCFAHLAVNLFDDFFDFKNHDTEIRDQLAQTNAKIRTHKCSYIVEGKITLEQTFLVACLLALLAIICGLIIFFERGWTIALFAGIGAFLGFFYSALPFRLCYHGLGELVCFLMFGPLLMTGIYFSSCNEVNNSIILVGCAIGLLVTNILFTHSVLDETSDICSRKRTLSSIIKGKNGKLIASSLFTFLPFIIILFVVFIEKLSYWYLLTYITLPLAIVSLKSLRDFVYNSQSNLTHRWWYGRMENWDLITNHGLDWFMFRWYLTRNLVIQFSVIISIISIVKIFV